MEIKKGLHRTCTNTLPDRGWVKPCLRCTAPTSRTFIYFYKGDLYE